MGGEGVGWVERGLGGGGESISVTIWAHALLT